MREAFEVVQEDAQAQIRRKPPNGRLQAAFLFGNDQRLLGVGGIARKLWRIGIVIERDALPRHPPPRGAPIIATCIDGHRVQPRRRVFLDVETADVTPNLEEDVLRDVLGRIHATHEPMDDRENAIEVMIEKPTESLSVARVSALQLLTIEGRPMPGGGPAHDRGPAARTGRSGTGVRAGYVSGGSWQNTSVVR